ncbi:hypothetical protein ACRQ1B_03280 [Rhizobium panacihumi]|uniref:hypothetical protein n=1 Tax=Rhizobium panacihumi TaxID=2008450 RepID=UPI003D7B5714
MSAAWDTLTQAMIMAEERKPRPNRRKIIMTAFAVVTAAIAAQTLVLEDGQAIYVETETPPIVWALMRKDESTVTIKSMHHTQEEAEARMKAEEALAERSESGSTMQ